MSQETTNNAWRKLVCNTVADGFQVKVRNSKIIEQINQTITIDPMYPFITFVDRNYRPEYCKKELQWKIYADKYDSRIEKHATMWSSVKNHDGSFNSNYGLYWFRNNGIRKAVSQLIKDKYSRRATIPMLASEHVSLDVKDSVCTEAMTFLIRYGALHCIVHMRSSDQVFGLGTDLPSFAMVQRLVYAQILQEYPDVTMGGLSVTAASSHIYERHFKMVNALISGGWAVSESRSDIEMPLINYAESEYILNKYMWDKSATITAGDNDHFLKWLMSDGEL